MSAFRVEYVNELQSFEGLIPPRLHSITKNVYISDKYIMLNKELLKKERISHIVCLLPSQEIADELTKDVKGEVYITVLDYGIVYEPVLDKRTKETCDMIEKIAKEKNILIFCNNGYQRTMPFLFYYLTKYKGKTLEEAADTIFRETDRKNWCSHFKDRHAFYKLLIEDMKKIIL